MTIDKSQLWVRLRGEDAVWLIEGNPHTHQGRMGAVDPNNGDAISFSASEVTDASDLARAWIAGFLCGSEPTADDMFGVGIFDADDDDPRWERWRSALDSYRRTGDWPYAPWSRHLLPIPPDADVPADVWTVRGDELWRWRGDHWEVDGEQPMQFFGMPGETICARPDGHSMVVVSTAHIVCEHCGYTAQVLPEGMTREQFEREEFGYVPAVAD